MINNETPRKHFFVLMWVYTLSDTVHLSAIRTRCVLMTLYIGKTGSFSVFCPSVLDNTKLSYRKAALAVFLKKFLLIGVKIKKIVHCSCLSRVSQNVPNHENSAPWRVWRQISCFKLTYVQFITSLQAD